MNVLNAISATKLRGGHCFTIHAENTMEPGHGARSKSRKRHPVHLFFFCVCVWVGWREEGDMGDWPSGEKDKKKKIIIIIIVHSTPQDMGCQSTYKVGYPKRAPRT